MYIRRKVLFIFAFIFVISIVPLFLYLFLPFPQIIPGLRGDKIWLEFWGSYLGGILTAIIGFITLFSANKRFQIQLEITEKEKELEYLKNNLNNCVKSLNTSQISSIAFYLYPYAENKILPTTLDINMATKLYFKLDDLCNNLLDYINSFGVVYQPDLFDNKNEINICKYEFCCAYSNASTHIKDQITNMQVQIRKLIAGERNENIINKEETYYIIYQIASDNTYKTTTYPNLQKSANKWIKALEKEIDDLKSKCGHFVI